MAVRYKDPNDNSIAAARASNDLPGFGRAPQHAAGYGQLTQAQGQQFNQYNNDVLAKMFPGVDPSQVTTWLQQHPGPEADKINTQVLQGVSALANPDTGFEKAMQAIALGLSVGSLTAGFGAIAAPAIAGAVGGGAAGSIAGGAATGAVGAAGKDLLTTGGVSGKDVGIGALGGGIASAAAPLASGINNATGIGSTASNALIKAGVGAASSGLRGGSALQGGLAGGLGSLAGAGLGAAGVGGLASGFLGNQIGNFASNTLAGNSNGAARPAGQNNMMGGGSIQPQYQSGGTTNPFLSTMGNNLAIGGGANTGGGNFLGNLGGLFGAGMGVASNNQQSNLQQNAYTTAGNAGNYNPFNFSGLGGMGSSFANGTGTLSAGGFNPQAFQGLTNTALGSAGQYAGGGLPQGVAQAGNNYMSALGGAQGNAGAGMGAGLGMFNQGANLVGGANGTYNSAYNTSLNAAQQALQQPLQQQYNTLRNQQFETGMSGTSGGALQTQAFATGMGQAELQAQQNAVGQANTAQSNALGYGSNLMNSGLNNFGQFNTQGAGFAGQGMNAQMGLGSYSPQLSQLYSNLANTGVSGLSGVQGMDTGLAQLGLQGMQIGGNNMNNAARTQGGIAQSNNYTNPNSGYSTALNSLFGNGSGGSSGNGLLGGLGSMFSSLFGGAGGGNNPSAFGLNQTGQLSNNFDTSGGTQNLIDSTAPTFDFSNIGNQMYTPPDLGNIDTSGFTYGQ